MTSVQIHQHKVPGKEEVKLLIQRKNQKKRVKRN